MKLTPFAIGLSVCLGCQGGDSVLHTFKKVQVSAEFHSEGAHFADFNRDGKNDIVAGPFWYEGPTFQKKHEYYGATAFDPHNYSKNFFTFTHDFNGDSWPDIMVIGMPGEETWWYENPQGKDGMWQRYLVIPVTDNESPTLTDINGDGKPELVCNSGGYFGYATPDRSDAKKPWTFHPVTPKGKWERYTHGLGVGDVNGDGRMDLLEKDGWWEQPASLANDPAWVQHAFPFAPGGGAQLYAYDVDGDGDNDVITCLTAHGYGLSWYENVKENGQVTFKCHTFMNKEPEENKYGVHFSQLHALDLIDFDGDGLKDILTGKRYWAHGPTGDPEPMAAPVLYWFKLVRGPNHSVDYLPYLIDDQSGVGTQAVAGDINGDGLPDVVISNKRGAFVFLQEKRTVTREEYEKAQPKVYRAGQ